MQTEPVRQRAPTGTAKSKQGRDDPAGRSRICAEAERAQRVLEAVEPIEDEDFEGTANAENLTAAEAGRRRVGLLGGYWAAVLLALGLFGICFAIFLLTGRF